MPKLRKTLPKDLTDFCYKQMNNYTSEDIEKCKEMLEPCDPNARDRGGYKETALHKMLPLEIIEWLIARGADVNAANTYGTPLFKHAHWGNYDICKFLIEHDADVNIVAHAGHTVLLSAVSGINCNYDIVRLLLEHGADPCHHSENWDGQKTPLLTMLSRGVEVWKESKADIAELLISAQKGQGGIPKDEWAKAQEYISDIGHEFELHKSDMEVEHCNKVEMIMKRYYAIFDVTPAEPVIKHDGKSLIEVDKSISIGEQHHALWEFLVPSSGRCITMQGEVIRVTGRIDGEINRNGGANWDTEYRRMLGSLTKYFLQGNTLNKDEIEDMKDAINEINTHKAACIICQKAIDKLMELAVKWVIQNPDPIPLGNIDYNR